MAIEPGERLDIPKRAKTNEERFTPTGRRIRSKINDLGGNIPVQLPNENLQKGSGVAALATVLVYTIEDYLPVRLGADVSVANTEIVEPGVVEYVIDVNAALENQAELKAMVDAGTGFTSLWSDTFTIQEKEVVHKRPARDTYRYKMTVEV